MYYHVSSLITNFTTYMAVVTQITSYNMTSTNCTGCPLTENCGKVSRSDLTLQINSGTLNPMEVVRDLDCEQLLSMKQHIARIASNCFTGCAVAQHCYNGDVRFLWENLEL